MLKRGVILCSVLAMSVSACATVTMIPGEAAVVTVTQEQTALREASRKFDETAESRGWITESNGLFDLARILVDGQSTDASAEKAHYADLIGVGSRPSVEIMRSLESDAFDAASALDMVTDVADAFLDPALQQQTARADLMAYERALVNAQKCRRSFLETTARVGGVAPASTEAALTAFDAEIDRARLTADRLAAEYSGRIVGATS